jgi:hypothetical protein
MRRTPHLALHGRHDGHERHEGVVLEVGGLLLLAAHRHQELGSLQRTRGPFEVRTSSNKGRERLCDCSCSLARKIASFRHSYCRDNMQ